MRLLMKRNCRQLALVCAGLLPLTAPAGENVLLLSLEELSRLPVTAGVGYAQPRTEVPGTATVIRAAQWEALGARSVYDVLQQVPGLHVVETGRSERSVIARGLLTTNNSQVLWLLDGQPLNDLSAGGPVRAFDKGLAGLERIEVIRGPVSVIHGSNAFSAVINLVSQPAGAAERRLGIKGGAFDSREALAEAGGGAGDWRWRVSLESRASDGDPDRIVRHDVQSRLDALFGTSVSRAPGALPSEGDAQEALLNLGWRDTSLQAWHWRGTADGYLSNDALDPTTRNEAAIDQLLLRQAGTLAPLQTRWELEGLWQRQDSRYATTALPPGTTVPIGASGDIDPVTGTPLTFPQGFIASGRTQSERKRLSVNLINTAWQGHTLRLGLGREWQELRDLESRRNFGIGVIDSSAPVVPLTPLPNLAGTPLSILPADRRHLTFIALQDDWRLSSTLLLNLGVRHDRYSDFGGSSNPRASLQWQAGPSTRLQLGYGTAFRAPSFTEQNLRNNPAILGNPNLEAEELESAELSMEQGLAPGLQLEASLFRYEARRLVDYAPRPPVFGNVAQNIKGREGQGGSLEMRWKPQPGAQLNASVTVWDVHDSTSSNEAPFVPGHMATLNGWWEFAPRWTLGGSLKYVADREREAGDPRTAIRDNSWADLHLHTTALAPKLRLGVTVQNVGDADLRDPMRNNAALGPAVPDDLPLAGRRWLLEAEYRWGGGD